jgi:hypothetical protein
VFFAIAQCFGAFGSHWYGHLIGDGHDRNTLFVGYMVGAIAMIAGGLAAVFFGVNAEGKALEDVARPLPVISKPAQTIFRAGDPGPAEGVVAARRGSRWRGSERGAYDVRPNSKEGL